MATPLSMFDEVMPLTVVPTRKPPYYDRRRIASRPASLDGVRYSGAIRIAPSSRTTEPFMKVFSAM